MHPKKPGLVYSDTVVTIKDRTQTLREWADEYKLTIEMVRRRINQDKWDVERALVTKPNLGNLNRKTAYDY